MNVPPLVTVAALEIATRRYLHLANIGATIGTIVNTPFRLFNGSRIDIGH